MKTKDEILTQTNKFKDAIRGGEFTKFEYEYSSIMHAILEVLIDIRDAMINKGRQKKQ